MSVFSYFAEMHAKRHITATIVDGSAWLMRRTDMPTYIEDVDVKAYKEAGTMLL